MFIKKIHVRRSWIKSKLVLKNIGLNSRLFTETLKKIRRSTLILEKVKILL